jgi:hypothetical protein
MDHRNTPHFRKRAQAALHRLQQIGPFIAASLVCVHHRCGSPTCHCASGKGHPSWRLTYKSKGQKTKTVYVPVDLVEEVRLWTQEHRRLKKLVAEISAAQIELVRLHVTEKRRKRKPSA